MSKLFTIIERHLPDGHAYADDTQLYLSFKPDRNQDQAAALNAMQNCFEDITEEVDASQRIKPKR